MMTPSSTSQSSCAGDPTVHRHFVKGPVHRGWRLREEDRDVRRLGVLLPRGSALLDVRRVVEPQAEDVLPRTRNRRVQPDASQFAARVAHGFGHRGGALPLGGSGLDERQQRGRAPVDGEVEDSIAAQGAQARRGIGQTARR